MPQRTHVISREQAVAYRLDGHRLNERAAAEQMVSVAAAMCVQNTPQGSAGQALAARVDSAGERDVIHALEEDKTLLQAFGARTDQWLGADACRDTSPTRARAELVRRYLRCYGPSTPEHFAAWGGGGIGLPQAKLAWAPIRADLREVSFMDATAWLLDADADRLQSAPRPTGVRLLPPRDPYLQTRDRVTLVEDRSLHRRVWRATGAPGAILVNGRLCATWRPRSRGRTLDIRVEPLDHCPHGPPA